MTVPVSSIGGWYDIFLPGQLRDFMTLQEAGRTARLTVGPWTHLSTDPTMMREAIEFGLACARGEALPPRKPVRLYVMGGNVWREFESWPPPGYPSQPFYLAAGGTLAAEPPGDCAPDAYRYDPADPTPAVGGVRMVFRSAGRVAGCLRAGPGAARRGVQAGRTAPAAPIDRARNPGSQVRAASPGRPGRCHDRSCPAGPSETTSTLPSVALMAV